MTSRYEVFDPFAELPDESQERDLAKLGWEKFMDLGDDNSPMILSSYSRSLSDGRVEYLVEVWGSRSYSPYLRIDNFADLMDLFARWAPAVQTAAIVKLIDDVHRLIDDVHCGRLSDFGVVERVAARVAYGLEEVLPAMLRQKRR